MYDSFVMGIFFFKYLCVGYIFQNLPGGTFNDVVRILLSIELTLTFPIVIKPATDVMEEILKNVLTVRIKYKIILCKLVNLFLLSVLQKSNH